MFSLFTAAALFALPFSTAIVTPTSPDGNTVVKVGDTIEALWTVDSADSWTNLEIQLMTGDNLAMVPLATVATGIDGTSTSSYSFAAPDVSPYSKIYFLQFTNGGDTSNVTWTTRFTIAGSDGSTTEPTNSTVYSGSAVEWGTGTLLSTVSTDSSSSSNTASGTSSAASTAAVSSAAESSSTAAETSAESTSSASSAAASTTAASSSGAASASTAAAAASSSSPSSGASRLQAGLFGGVLAGLVGVALL
ncbi:hypothetical protein IAT38_000019 [Cryptococcus sp. DSM 104549]